MKQPTVDRDELRAFALSSLPNFIETVDPKRVLGNIHRELAQWWYKPEARSHQLVLLPRDHMKSAFVAYRAVMELTKDPTLKILYISSTSNLAVKQLSFIKKILTAPNYRLLWPEMVKQNEFEREKWAEREIAVDHPLRRDENIREPSIFTAGLTTNIVGLHCDIAILDDVVVAGNAYHEDLREKVREQYGYLSSVEGANAREWVVGTRYHPEDLYAHLLKKEIETYDDLGNVSSSTPLFEVFERQVESLGDGTGEFLWPLQQRSDGKWFGFNADILAKKRAQYDNKTHFRAQYYNDPHDVGASAFKRELFQYYEPGYLSQRNGKWFFKGERLNTYAAVDFAFTTGLKSDYTAIVVIGLDARMNYYVLEIDRFRTESLSEIFKRLLKLHEKWGFLKLRAEVTSAQKVLVQDLKESYIRPLGLSLTVEEFLPQRKLGAKEERILAALEPKYANGQMWHYRSGNCQVLEEELLFSNPAHDDIKDALASVVDSEFARAPMNIFKLQKDNKLSEFQYHGRFGGVS